MNKKAMFDHAGDLFTLFIGTFILFAVLAFYKLGPLQATHSLQEEHIEVTTKVDDILTKARSQLENGEINESALQSNVRSVRVLGFIPGSRDDPNKDVTLLREQMRNMNRK